MKNIDKSLKTIKRGVVEIIGEKALVEKLSRGKPLRIKLGVDPTSTDLHLGHTVVLKKLRQFQDLGHQVVFLVGDFTARIGDPSGRDETRPVMNKETILENAKTYQEQVFRILDKSKTEVVYNNAWFMKIGIEGLLDLARRCTVAQMLHRADFKERYSKGRDITIVEFLYPLLQGYDSVEIKADIELGGTDQIFNLLMGREIQKDFGQEPQVVITMPLLEGTDGVKKMSKTYENYIALNDTPKDMFGKLMSISDELMYKYYELLTFEDMEKVKKLHPKEAKEQLAEIITSEYHGKEKAQYERKEFKRVFSRKSTPQNLVPVPISKPGTKLIDALRKFDGTVSNKEWKRLLEQGAIKIDDKKITQNIEIDFYNKNELKVQVGKIRFFKFIKDY